MSQKKDEAPLEFQKERQTCFIKELVPAKLTYFLFYALIGITFPYLNPFFVDIGLSIEQAGYINGFRTLFPLVASPFIGLVADYTKKRKLILETLLILNILIYSSVPWLVSLLVQQGPSSNIISGNAAYVHITQNNKMYINPNHTSEDYQTNILKNDTVIKSNMESFNQKLFVLIFSWGILLAVTGFPAIGMVDQIVMQIVSDFEKETSYGIQRLFAPIGYTVGTFLSGAMIDIYKSNPFLSKYTAIFFCGTPFAVLNCISIYFLKTKTVNSERLEKKSIRFIFKKLIQDLTELKMIMFLITVFLMGLGYNLVNGYLVLFLERELNTPKTVTGLILAISSICQIVVFPFSAQLKEMLGGAYPCFILALISYFARFLLFSFIKSYWLALPIQLFESTGYALFWAAAVEFVHKHTSKDVATTLFNVMVVIYYNISNTISNVAGGEIYQYHGGRRLFQIMASLCGAWSAIMTVWFLCLLSKRTQHSERKISKPGIAEYLIQ